MADPINYGAAFANTPNPFDSFAKGMGLGNAMLAQMDAAQQARAQAEQARILEEARQRVTSGNASAQDRVNYLSMVAPEQAKAMQDALSQMDKTVAHDRARIALQVATAVETGNLDVAKQILGSEAQAYKNSGTPQGEQQAAYFDNVLIKELDTRPTSVQNHLLGLVAMSPNGKDMIDAYNSNKKLPSEINLLDAQAAQAWANSLRDKTGALKTVQDREESLRKEYLNQTGYFQQLRNYYGNIKQSPTGNDKATGASDISLVYNYMKMLDPTSVVREGEFATAQNSSGVPGGVMALYNNLLSGTKLDAKQRQGMVTQAQKIYDGAKQQEAIVRTGVKRIAEGYGIDPNNVFYEATVSDPGTVAGGAPASPKGVVDMNARTVAIPSGEVLRYSTQEEFDAAIKAMRAKGLID